MSRSRRILWMLFLVVCPVVASGQVSTGSTAFGSFEGGPDVVNVGNLNVHWTIPVRHKAGRGMSFDYDLGFDSSVWTPVGSSGSQTWVPTANWGWTSATAGQTGFLNYSTQTQLCYDINGHPLGSIVNVGNYVYTDRNGGRHSFSGGLTFYSGCPGTDTDHFTSSATDGSGFTLTVPSSGSTTIKLPNGTVFVPAFGGGGSGPATDKNGNQITTSVVSGNRVYTDTLGQTALTISPVTQNGAQYQQSFSYQDGNGSTSAVTAIYSQFTVATNFSCSGITQYPATSNYLISRINLPDGRFYLFTYEATPGQPGRVTGRVASVQLPSGGTISYQYTGGSNGIICADGSTAGLTRTVDDANGNVSTWTYSRQLVGSQWRTTVTTPENNQTVVSFLKGTPSGSGISNPAPLFFEVSRLTYQGLTSGTLLRTVSTCYNNNCSGPTAVTLPVTARDITSFFPDSTGKAMGSSETYSTLGMLTEARVFDYGALGSGARGSLLRKTTVQYASLGSIFDHPEFVTTYDGANNIIGKTTYQYDQTAVTATSGTPNHLSGNLGNVTTIWSRVSPTQSIPAYFNYYDTGLVKTATNISSGTTTYTYGACGNSLPTAVARTTGTATLTSNATWDCIGAVTTSVTDVNGHVSTTEHSDSLWRTTSAEDPWGNSTDYTYPTTSSNTLRALMTFPNFNGSSTATLDGLATYDGLGRVVTAQQKRPSSANYDTILSIYDVVGRPKKSSIPYIGSVGQQITTASGTTTLYDALSRPTSVSDSAGGTTSIVYSLNDVYVSLGPAPAGENLKRKQFEYDGLGRLTSVCEVTSLTGAASCGQSVARTGYRTQSVYTTDAQGRTTLTVTQNAQAGTGTQTRIVVTDSLGRTLSETNPETGNTASGTSTYVYDTDPTGICPGTYTGDLIKSTDNAGNVSCYTYDKLHRQLSAKTVSGPNSGSTPQRYFVYDTVSVPGFTLQNLAGNLARAYTCTGTCSSKITDILYSYYPEMAGGTPTGRFVVDSWEATPNSGAYNQTREIAYPNGTRSELAAFRNGASFGFPRVAYGIDGKGRPVTARDLGTSTDLVTATTYNPGNQILSASLGSGDTDSYTYDAITRRLTQYTFSGTGYTVTGQITWNTNGSVQQFQYTDSVDPTKNQTCTYAADDLQRIASVNCGAAWSQTFTYDPFGNIKKSGTLNYLPTTYNPATNKPSGGVIATFDNNGNMLTDGSNSYLWDAYGVPTTVNTTSVVTDALGRTAEVGSGPSAKQFLYSPSGAKIAVVQGATLNKGLIPLPGGSIAVYNASGFAYFRHSDMLGSSRLATRWNHTRYSTTAYAPFGETYSESGTQDRSFTGQDQDTATGTFDFLLRRYNPTSGRWISPDPVGWDAVVDGDPQSLNRYAYVRNSPLTYLDPDGAAAYSEGEILPNGTMCTVNTCYWPDPPAPPSPPPSPRPPDGPHGPVGGPGGGPVGGGPGGGAPGGSPGSVGFTLGVRAPNQTFGQCMEQNASNYSLAGVADLATNGAVSSNDGVNFAANVFGGNSITGTYYAFAGTNSDSAYNAVTTGAGFAGNATSRGMGTVTTYGRRTSDIASLNIAGKGGLPRALGSSAGGAKSFLRKLGTGTLKLAVDAGLTLAEGVGCLIPQ